MSEKGIGVGVFDAPPRYQKDHTRMYRVYPLYRRWDLGLHL